MTIKTNEQQSQTKTEERINKYSFDTGKEQTQEERPATDRQRSYYMEQCYKKNILPIDTTGLTYQQLSEQIEKVNAYVPLSDKQKQLILSLEERLIKAGAISAPFDKKVLRKLTGGREGTGQRFIRQLMEKEREYGANGAPSEKQVELLVQMFHCWDIPFEEYEITRKVELPDIQDKKGNNMWKFLTPDQFAEQIKEKMTREDASKFLDAHIPKFNVWRQNRATDAQVKHIERLEKRIADIRTPRQVTQSINLEGDIIEQLAGDSRDDYAPEAYEPTPHDVLKMMTKDDAQTYIRQLQIEKDAVAQFHYNDHEETHFEDVRRKNNANNSDKDGWSYTQEANEYADLTNLMFGLFNKANYRDEDILHALRDVVDTSNPDKNKKAKAQVHDFMKYLMDEDYVDFNELLGFCSESPIAQQILTGRY